MSDEKRTYKRYDLLFPVTLSANEAEVVGVCRQAGAGGALISASAPVEPGAEVVVRFRLSADLRDERTVKASVVRQELTEGELALAFPYCIAVEFAEPDPDLLDDLGAHSTRMPAAKPSDE